MKQSGAERTGTPREAKRTLHVLQRRGKLLQAKNATRTAHLLLLLLLWRLVLLCLMPLFLLAGRGKKRSPGEAKIEPKCPPGRPPGARGAPGPKKGRSKTPFERLLEALGAFLGRPWRLWGRSWGAPGVSWAAPEASRAPSWGSFWPPWGAFCKVG